MFTLIIAGAALGAMQPLAPPPAHHVEHTHREQPVRTSYHGDIQVERKQIGHSAPNRMNTARCTWTSTITVERRVHDATRQPMAGLSRVVDKSTLAKGSRPGGCMETRKGVHEDVARNGAEKAREHLAAVAERDRSTLLAELESAHNLRLASN